MKADRGGAIGSIADLLGRCWIDPLDPGHDTKDGPCWHLRRASGRPYQCGDEQKVWLPHLAMAMRPTTAAWRLAHPDEPVPRRRRVYRACCSHDCANPDHMRIGTVRQANQAAVRRGALQTPARLAAQARLAQQTTKLTEELKLWAIESRQSAPQAAWGLMVGTTTVRSVRQARRRALARLQALEAMSSIFKLGGAMNREVD